MPPILFSAMMVVRLGGTMTGVDAEARIGGADGGGDTTSTNDARSLDGDIKGYGIPTQFQRTSFNIGSSRIATGRDDGAADSPIGVDVNYASVPLDFWFCRNPGLALPLIALQYHEVKINLQLTSQKKLVNVARRPNPNEIEAARAADAAALTADGSATGVQVTTALPTGLFHTNPDASSISLWADYIYLDTDERRRFAQVSHEYLIEQVQHIFNPPSTSKTINLNFNHPVKELIWCGSPNDNDLSDTLRIQQKSLTAGARRGAKCAEPGTFSASTGILMDTGAGRTIGISQMEGTNLFNSDLQTYRGDGVKIQCGPSVPTPLASDNRGAHLNNLDGATWTIKLNGHERFAPRHPRIFYRYSNSKSSYWVLRCNT